jgi:hypothetical protein
VPLRSYHKGDLPADSQVVRDHSTTHHPTILNSTRTVTFFVLDFEVLYKILFKNKTKNSYTTTTKHFKTKNV